MAVPARGGKRPWSRERLVPLLTKPGHIKTGALSDKLQKRKPLALVGYFVAAVAKPLMGLATSWPGVFAARLLDRIGDGTRWAAPVGSGKKTRTG
jgi:hypothetical protein